MSIRVGISASAGETAELVTAGPRRDYVELATSAGGVLHLRPPGGGPRGGWRKLFGTHLRQAWQLAGKTRRGDVLFADGEHLASPLLASLTLRRRHPERIVFIVHRLRWWKRVVLGVTTRLGSSGTIVVHSERQEQLARKASGRRWQVRLVPYQVDTGFWNAAASVSPAPEETPLILAVGAEDRDYDTLVQAAHDLAVRVVIAGGSHWARSIGTATSASNVERPGRLTFEELRALYQRAAVVVVPLLESQHAAGVTAILEGMAMGRPLVVTATGGQRETVRGPLVTAASSRDDVVAALAGPSADTGLRVPVGDAAALRRAIEILLADPETGQRLGTAARAAACARFSLEQYVESLSALLQPGAMQCSEPPPGAPH